MTPPSPEMMERAKESVKWITCGHCYACHYGTGYCVQPLIDFDRLALALTAAHAQGRAEQWKEVRADLVQHFGPRVALKSGNLLDQFLLRWDARAAEEARRG